ncbi:MAG: aldehyde dehydrogenase [Verrucomicrobia bacterium]|nr:aldehyde dehydrogenase [Verrucomicrobiota bacterium]MCF7707330.1 aldehyde dehydrogenase [Verrucomicrobiota bacterium]
MTHHNINEELIKDVVEEVLGRLGHSSGDAAAKPAPAQSGNPAVAPSITTQTATGGRRFGVFQDARSACAAAAVAHEQLNEKGVDGRRRVIDIVKTLADKNSAEWGRIELEESGIGRLDHKIEKLKIIKLVPGVEFLHPEGMSGDHGITLEEYTPFGVIGAITPSTHSIPTISGNVVSMVAAGNAVVFNPHPGAKRCAVTAVRAYNEAIYRELGIENLICVIEEPTIESFKGICESDAVGLLCVTGGPGVVKAAMKTGKRAVCAGPGNPPVLVDETADINRAANGVVTGAAYDNNLLCIGEKEVFVLESVADSFMQSLEKNGGFRLNADQWSRLTKEVFTFKEGEGAGCPMPVLNKAMVGKDAVYLARIAGAAAPAGTEILFAETGADDAFVEEEQMMPVVPVVRVKSVEEGISAAKKAEHGFKHTSIIHSHDVSRMTAMARALKTTLFVKNGPSVAGLGIGGEGYLSYSIATPTGEGITNPKTFTRVRRCVMVDNLRIY